MCTDVTDETCPKCRPPIWAGPIVPEGTPGSIVCLACKTRRMRIHYAANGEAYTFQGGYAVPMKPGAVLVMAEREVPKPAPVLDRTPTPAKKRLGRPVHYLLAIVFSMAVCAVLGVIAANSQTHKTACQQDAVESVKKDDLVVYNHVASDADLKQAELVMCGPDGKGTP